MDDSHVLFQDLPCRIKGFTQRNYEDGHYTIVLNSRISVEEQQCAYLHEIQHIINKDFAKNSANKIEFAAHKVREEID